MYIKTIHYLSLAQSNTTKNTVNKIHEPLLSQPLIMEEGISLTLFSENEKPIQEFHQLIKRKENTVAATHISHTHIHTLTFKIRRNTTNSYGNKIVLIASAVTIFIKHS